MNKVVQISFELQCIDIQTNTPPQVVFGDKKDSVLYIKFMALE